MRRKPRTPCEFPFTGGYVLKFNSIQDRTQIRIYEEGKNPRCMNLSRYKMCVKEKRILETKEEVHHIDENKLNDDIDNLEILNKSEHAILHNGIEVFISLLCPCCMKKFKIPRHSFRSRSLKTDKPISCSLSCAQSINRHLQPIQIK